MYEAYFGLTKRPFSLSPDTGLYVNLDDHQRCFDLLIHVLASGEGFLKVIGEVGTGKTVLCRKLLHYLETEQVGRLHSVYIPNPMLSPIGLYRAVGQELGLSEQQQADNDALLNRITERILQLAVTDQGVVIVIDEAQSLPPETLEALRLISNLETETKKLVQIILFGQTELEALLNQERFRQLRQRITFSHRLQPLSAAQTQQYIEYRLQRSGYNGPPLFQRSAMSLLHRAAGGVPRMINVLAHKALLVAFAEQIKHIQQRHIRLAVYDHKAPPKHSKLALICVILSACLFVFALTWKLL